MSWTDRPHSKYGLQQQPTLMTKCVRCGRSKNKVNVWTVAVICYWECLLMVFAIQRYPGFWELFSLHSWVSSPSTNFGHYPLFCPLPLNCQIAFKQRNINKSSSKGFSSGEFSPSCLGQNMSVPAFPSSSLVILWSILKFCPSSCNVYWGSYWCWEGDH